ncbi:MAG: alpha-N-arabinofuranosidase, partial [Bacteroidia bacterium]|nr:alpha-N-arabinofuranosidase [Bacteroidia bacterium]
KSVNVRALSETGATLQIRLNSVGGPIIAEVKILKNKEWNTINAPLTGSQQGIRNLVVMLKDAGNVEIDWISFE